MLPNGHAACLRMPGRLAHRSLGTVPRTQLLPNNASLRSLSTTACASISRRSAASTRAAASTFAPTLRTAPLRRTLTTSAPRSSQKPFSFLTAYAFQGKPRHSEDATQEGDSSSSAAADEPEASASGASEDGAKRGQIGFPADSEIGRWRDELLRGGEAGEDSLMCTSMGAAGDVAIGVADGVGGWTENGIDPSLFSQALMFYASRAAVTAPAGSASTNGNGAPNRILAEAFEHVLKEPLVIAGSATACILTMDASNGTLHSANLGDSGFVILRQGTGKHGVFHASPPQQLGFNTPLQLAKLPKEWIQEGSISNTPKDAAAWECTLQHGDLIIVGTDGLFDNVDAKIEIPQFAKFIKEKHHASYAARHAGADKPSDSLQEDREFVQVLATNLVEYAKICQNSTTKQSPFEREAARYGIHFPGGKIDDVAIVCCLVIER